MNNVGGEGRFPLTVIVLTRDEERNIAACLESVAWADDVLILDSGSNDGTLDEARRVRGDVRILVRDFTDFGDQRNWALDHGDIRNEWILFLDADERITAKCAAAIMSAVKSPGRMVGYYLCNRYMFMGTWIRHSSLYPSWQLRLLKSGRVRFRAEGHGQREVTDGPLGYISEPYDHYGMSKGIAEWIARHNEYSSREVELLERLAGEHWKVVDLLARDPIVRRRALKIVAARVPARPLVRFVYTYILRGGFLDGRAGLVYCLLRLAHEIHIWAKRMERRYVT